MTLCLYIWFDHIASRVEIGPGSPTTERMLKVEAVERHFKQGVTRVFRRHRNEGMVIVDPGTTVPRGALTLELLAHEIEGELSQGSEYQWIVSRRPEA